MKRIVISLLVFFILAAFRSSAQLKIGDQPTIIKKAVALDAQGSNGLQGLWLPRVSDTSVTGIRSLSPPDGLIIYHPPSGKLFIRSNNTWVTYLSQAITTISSASQSVAGSNVSFQAGTYAGTANDFNIAANSAANTVTFNMPDASTAIRGVVNTGAQTLGGAKTFANGITVNNGGTVDDLTVRSSAVIQGATGATSNLQLGITSATTPATITPNTLSLDPSGNVIFTTTNVQANKPSFLKSYTTTIIIGSISIAANSTYTLTIDLPPGANVTVPASVAISPGTMLNNGTTIDFATVTGLNTVKVNISTRGTAQTIPNGFVFYETIVDF